jgi:enoyl-CoA hydratase/carnithine racemase
VVGPGRARLLTLTGDPIPATKAYDWGLVERVVAASELDEAALELAQSFSDRSALALGIIKSLLLETSDGAIADGLALEAAAFGRCIESPDGREGVTAFLEKRLPVWSTRSGQTS